MALDYNNFHRRSMRYSNPNAGRQARDKEYGWFFLVLLVVLAIAAVCGL